MRDRLFDEFTELKCLGRVYIANEGINAQMNVPESNFQDFDKFIQSIPEFSGVQYKMAVEEKGKNRLVPGQDAEIALLAGDLRLPYVLHYNFPVRGYDAETESLVHRKIRAATVRRNDILMSFQATRLHS